MYCWDSNLVFIIQTGIQQNTWVQSVQPTGLFSKLFRVCFLGMRLGWLFVCFFSLHFEEINVEYVKYQK